MCACGEDISFSGDGLRAWPHGHSRGDPRHDVRVTGLTHTGDSAILNADVALVDAGIVHDQHVRDHAVQAVHADGPGSLAHAIAEGFASSKLALVAVYGEVSLDLYHQPGISEMYQIASRRPKHCRVCAALHCCQVIFVLRFPFLRKRIFRLVLEAPLLPFADNGADVTRRATSGYRNEEKKRKYQTPGICGQWRRHYQASTARSPAHFPPV